MKTMGFTDLGQITLMQSICSLTMLIHFGLINGGYRICASGNIAYNKKINDNVLTSLLAISILIITTVYVIKKLEVFLLTRDQITTIIFGISVGICSLFSTWMNNILIAEKKLGRTNLVNITSISVSTLFAIININNGIIYAYFSLLIQPFLASLLFQLMEANLRPKFRFEGRIILDIYKLGITPFFAGLITILNLQIERWYIAAYLGVENLGKYTIVIFFTTLFGLIPAAVMNIYYSKAILSFEEGNKKNYINTLKSHSKIILTYIFIVILLLIFTLNYMVQIVFPKFTNEVELLYIALPGLIALILFDIASLFLYSAKKMIALLLFPLFVLIIFVTLIYLVISVDALSLGTITTIKSISYISSFIIVILLIYYKYDFKNFLNNKN